MSNIKNQVPVTVSVTFMIYTQQGDEGERRGNGSPAGLHDKPDREDDRQRARAFLHKMGEERPSCRVVRCRPGGRR